MSHLEQVVGGNMFLCSTSKIHIISCAFFFFLHSFECMSRYGTSWKWLCVDPTISRTKKRLCCFIAAFFLFFFVESLAYVARRRQKKRNNIVLHIKGKSLIFVTNKKIKRNKRKKRWLRNNGKYVTYIR